MEEGDVSGGEPIRVHAEYALVRLRALQTAIDGLLNYKVMPGDEKPILVRMADNSGQKRQRA
jgi:hypothetical protein